MTSMGVTYRPTLMSSVLAVGFALAVFAFLEPVSSVIVALGVEAVGLLMIGIGVHLSIRGHRVFGSLLGIVGVTVAALAFLYFVGMSHQQHGILLVVLPGMLGAFLLALGLFPVYGTGSRALVKTGTAFVFIGVLVAGVFRTPANSLLIAGVLTVLAWDTGEQAINVGEHLGIDANTTPIELTHLVGSITVGIIAVFISRLLDGMMTTGLTLGQFTLLLVALLFLTLALHE